LGIEVSITRRDGAEEDEEDEGDKEINKTPNSALSTPNSALLTQHS
jgi:hypothetical protein